MSRIATIRPAAAGDEYAACDILHQSIAHCCMADHQGEAALVQAWLRNKTPEMLALWIVQPDHRAWIAHSGTAPAGFAMHSTRGEILLCYVTPAALHSGVGKQLLHAMEASARALRLRGLSLQSTCTARSFYLRNGYEESGPAMEAFGMPSHPLRKQFGSD